MSGQHGYTQLVLLLRILAHASSAMHSHFVHIRHLCLGDCVNEILVIKNINEIKFFCQIN